MRRRLGVSPSAETIEAVALGIAILVLVAFFHTYAINTAGGSDSYGYVSEALRLGQGHFYEPEHVLSRFGLPENSNLTYTLGYTPHGEDGTIPTYPFGYPLLMVVALRIAGFPAVFWVTPVLAAGTLILVYLLARTWLGSIGGVIAAAVTFLLPNFVWSSFQVLSDVSATFFATLALVCLFRPKPRPWNDVVVGAACGAAIWIRPNLALLVLPVFLWLIWQRDWRRIVRFGVAMLPFLLVEAGVNARYYGAPWRFGYGDVPLDHDLTSVAARGLRHLQRLQDQQAHVGLVLAVLGMLLGGLAWPRRLILAVIAFTFLIFVAFYPIDDAWWYGRFLLPAFPAVAVIEASFLVRALGPGRLIWLRRLAFAVGVAAFAWISVGFSRDHYVFQAASGEARYQVVAQLTRRLVRQPALVLAMQHGGSLRLYGGLATMRYDAASLPDILHVVDQVTQHGGAVYFAGESWERENIQKSDRSILLDGALEVGRLGSNGFSVLALNPPELPADLKAQRPIQAKLGEQISILGFDESSTTIRPGDSLTITLYWEASSAPPSDYSVFVHLEDDQNKIVAQSDSYPVDGRYPTSHWAPGYVVRDVHHIVVPTDARTGRVHVVAGMYPLSTMQRLPVRSEDGRSIGDHLALGEVTITGP